MVLNLVASTSSNSVGRAKLFRTVIPFIHIAVNQRALVTYKRCLGTTLEAAVLALLDGLSTDTTITLLNGVFQVNACCAVCAYAYKLLILQKLVLFAASRNKVLFELLETNQSL